MSYDTNSSLVIYPDGFAMAKVAVRAPFNMWDLKYTLKNTINGSEIYLKNIDTYVVRLKMKKLFK